MNYVLELTFAIHFDAKEFYLANELLGAETELESPVPGGGSFLGALCTLC